MDIKFKSLRIKNFRSVVDVSVDFTPGVYLVLGRNEKEEGTDSNGSAKSTVFAYSLPYVLFGKFKSVNGRTIRSRFERRNSDGNMSIELDLELSSHPVTVNRGRKGGKGFLKITGAKTPIKSDQELSFLVGCDFDAFTSLMVLTRASFESSLFYGTDAQRKDFFLSIAGIDKLVDQSLEVLKDEKTWYSLQAFEIGTVLDAEQKADSFESEIVLTRSRLSTFEIEIEKAKDVLNSYQSCVQGVADGIAQNDQQLKDLKLSLSKVEALKVDFDRINPMYEERGSIASSITQLNRSITDAVINKNKIAALSGGECPTCHQTVGAIYVSNIELTVQAFIEETQKIIEQKQILLEDLNKSIGDIEQLRKTVCLKENELKQSIQSLNEIKDRLNRELLSLTSEFEKASKTLEFLQTNRDDLTRRLEELSQKLLWKKRRFDAMKEDRQCFSGFETACIRWVNFMKEQLPAQALKDITKFLGGFAERCLKTLWDPRVSLKIFFNEDSQKPVIEVRDSEGVINDIDDLSGGEQARVFLSLVLGSIFATRSFRGWSSNLFVLDEVFDGLDRTGRETILMLLHEMAMKFDICVYVISHHQDYTISEGFIGGVYTAIKDDSGSRLVLN